MKNDLNSQHIRINFISTHNLKQTTKLVKLFVSKALPKLVYFPDLRCLRTLFIYTPERGFE